MGEVDVDLVRRAQQREVEAFAALVESHWCRLVALARSMVGDGEAEDAVQDSLVMAWRRLEQLNEPDAFTAWVFRIVTRACLRRIRRRRLLVPLAWIASRPDPGAADPETGIDVERVLGWLAPRQRAVMHLTVLEGMSDSEIGQALEIDAASVRSHRRRARERLKKALGMPGKGR